MFVDRFVTEGPGAKGVDMDASIKLIPYYSDQFKFFEQQRQEFGTRTIKFSTFFTQNILITFQTVPNSSECRKIVRHGIHGLCEFFACEEGARRNHPNLATVRKAENRCVQLGDHDLDKFKTEFIARSDRRHHPEILSAGRVGERSFHSTFDLHLCTLNSFRLQMQQLHVGQILYTDMSQFKAAVPFMAKLKNDALRSRHWQLLMEKTGHTFDMESGRFEVAHMFAMALYKHQVISKA